MVIKMKLEHLKQAILADFHDEFENVLGDLLFEMPPIEVLHITAEQLRNYLPVFEQYHSKVEWPRKLLSFLSKLEKFDYSSPSGFLLDETFESPGSNMFIRALYYLNMAVNSFFENSDSESISFAQSALLAVLAAQSYEWWARNNPENWESYEKLISDESVTEDERYRVESAYLREENRVLYLRNLSYG